MSRSTRYSMYTISKRKSCKAESATRQHVKVALKKMDINDPPVNDIEATPKSLGKEDWGTKMGYDVTDLLDEERKEDVLKAMRK